MNLSILVILGVVYFFETSEGDALTVNELETFLETDYSKATSEVCTKLMIAQWNVATDINNKTKEEIVLNVTLEFTALQKYFWKKYFKDLSPDDYKDEKIRRLVKFLRVLGIAVLSEDKLSELTVITTKMQNIYSTAKICPYKKQECNVEKEGLSLQPEIETVLATSSDYDELAYVWKAWRDASGVKTKELYKAYVKLSNEKATLNRFKDNGAMWRDAYESPTLVQDLDDLWKQVEPLYNELHIYVGKKLKERFGAKLDDDDGLLPAHLFGNMWAQGWLNLAPLVRPFPEVRGMDVDAALKRLNYTVLKMFETSDDFYKSMGLISNAVSYDTGKGAVIEKPDDGREIVCHASAWDFCDGKTYRIKMCAKVDFADFVTVHHEMGHIQYYLQYSKQPDVFRDGANPGFHEAVGDTIGLSVSTPGHLKKIGLMEDYEDDEKSSLNTLMDMALQHIAFLPFGLLIDKWRWDVFSGNVAPDDWNTHWWEYRKKYQKMKPPMVRSRDDFDAGAKYHVSADVPYISYFVSKIIQFQFYKSLCMAAGQYDAVTRKEPLYKCDFYGSVDAGNKLRNGLSLGRSRHWSDVLEVMTGDRKMDAGPLIEYFEPLYKFLKERNSLEMKMK